MRYFAASTQAQLGDRPAAQAEVERTLPAWPKFLQSKAHLWKWSFNEPDPLGHLMECAMLAGFRLPADSDASDRIGRRFAQKLS